MIRKRSDGYHDLETIFFPVPIHDVLEVMVATEGEGIQFQSTGLPIAGNPANNLCIKAYHLLKEIYPTLPAVRMHLHKVIPMGAGLGGGSSDGAFALKLLNEKFKLGIEQEQLLELALQLGSDCPFFLSNTPSIATGRGEHMQPIDLALSNHFLLLIHPGIHVSTAAAFAGIQPEINLLPLNEVVKKPVKEWSNLLINDFEKTVFPAHPLLAEIKQELYNMGAIYASLTGTGSTLFGIFQQQPESLPKLLNAFSHHICKIS